MGTGTIWTPTDWLKLVALLGGFGLFVLGAYMLYLGIAAEGVVDIKTSLFSGTLKTASAGLYICFFSLIVIVFALVSLYTPQKPDLQPKAVAKSRPEKLQPLFWGLLIGVIICAIGAAMTEAGARTVFISAGTTMGMGLLFLIAAIVRMTMNEYD
jgi:hypothetical protein